MIKSINGQIILRKMVLCIVFLIEILLFSLLIRNQWILLFIHSNFPNLRKPIKDKIKNVNIRVIDIETYLDHENNCIPYATGYKVGNDVKTYYINNNESTFNQVIVDMMNNIYKTDLSRLYFLYT